MRTHILTAIFIVLALAGCSSLDTVHYTGETTTLTVKSHPVEAELLCIADSCLYVIPAADACAKYRLTSGAVYTVPYLELQGMEVENIANNDWTYGILLMEVVPAILMGAAAASYGEGESFLPVTGALLIPAALNALLFVGGTAETPSVDKNGSPNAYRELRRYARFPQGLTPSQLESFMYSRKQGAVLPLAASLPDPPPVRR
jgi:hypothetical protein